MCPCQLTISHHKVIKQEKITQMHFHASKQNFGGQSDMKDD
jgi:hypothetical protein